MFTVDRAVAVPVPDTSQDEYDKDDPEWWLDCETDHPRPLVQLLSLLLHHPGKPTSANDSTLTLYCGTSGLTIHNLPNPQFQCTLELPEALYRRYHVAEKDASFSVSSKALIECLQVLCLIESPQELHMKYHGPSQVLRLEARLPRGGVASAALLGKIPPTESAELSAAFGACEVVARLLCASSHLQDTSELDLVQGVYSISIEFATTPETALTLSVVGHSSQCQVILPGPVEITGNTNTTIRYHYPFEAWKRAIKAIELAKETCLSINAQGILAIQHQILLPGQQEAAFCDSLLLPLILQDADDDDRSASSETVRQSTTTRATDDVSLSSRYSHALQSQPPETSMRTLEDTSTIATSPPRPADDSDTDESSTGPPTVFQHPPLTFGSSTAARPASTTDAHGSTRRLSERRRLSRQRRRSYVASSASSSSSLRESNEGPVISTHLQEQRQRKRGRSESYLSQDSASSSSKASPPSPPAQPEYCSSPEVVYGDGDML